MDGPIQPVFTILNKKDTQSVCILKCEVKFDKEGMV